MKLIMALITVGIVALLVIASSVTSEASSNMDDDIPTRAPTEPEGYWKTPTPGGIPPTEIMFITVMPAPTVVLPATATWAYPTPGDARSTLDPYPLPDSPDSPNVDKSETLKDILTRVFGSITKNLSKSSSQTPANSLENTMPLKEYQVGSNDLASAMFQRRYEPNFAWGNAAGMVEMLLNLRGGWLMGSVDESGNVLDCSGQGRTLADNGTVVHGLSGLAPYCEFDGATQYLSRADEAGLSITGELSLAGWFYIDDLTADNTLMSKWTEAGDLRSYSMTVNSTGDIEAAVSVAGAATVKVNGTVGDIVVNTWNFAAFVYTPSTEISAWVNKEKYTNAVAVPASIYDGNTAFMIGGVNGGASLDGKAALCWLSAAAQPDAVIRAFYEQTRALFGV